MSLKVYGDGHLLIRTLQSLPGVLGNRMVASVKTVLTCTFVIIGYGTMPHVLPLCTISVRKRTFFLSYFLEQLLFIDNL